MTQIYTLLRDARLHEGWSQQALADFAQVSLSSVQRAERGESLRVDICKRLCEALGKEKPEELGLRCYGAREGSAESTGAPYTGHEVDQKQSNEQITEISQSGYNNVNRRSFLQKSLVAAGATLIAPSQKAIDPEPWERFSRVLKRPSTIDETTLSHLEALTKSNWQLIPDVTGVVSTNLRAYTVEHLENVTELLEGSHSDAVHKRLCSIGGEFAMIAASMSSNLREFPKAQAYYQASIDAAHEADNYPLEAVGLASLAIRLTHTEHPDKALPLVQEARRLVTLSGSPTIRTWVAAVEAEVQANLGEYTACFRALDAAELVPHSASPSEDPYMTTFGPSLFAGYSGVCHMLFDQTEDAYKVLHDALTHLIAPSISRRCYILTDLALVCIRKGEIAEACTYANQALTLTAQAKSPALWQRIYDIHQQLEPWKDVQAVRDFNERLRLELGSKTRQRAERQL